MTVRPLWTPSSAPFRHTILKEGLALVHADRGDFCLWSESQRDLIVAASYGKSTLTIGKSAPGPGIVRKVWDSGESLLVPDVSSETNYFAANSETRSEIATCLKFERRPIGVLNAESFQLKDFDSQDLEVLEFLAQYAAIAVQVVGRETRLHGIAQQLTEHFHSRVEILKKILERVSDIYGFEAGLIYFADYPEHILRCLASIGCEESKVNPNDFTFRFNESAFATEIFNTQRGRFSLNPSNDPIVNQRGVEVFDIQSPMVGVPLIFEGKVVGVLVVWSRRNPPPTLEHIERLEPFARLAAANIAISEAERHRAAVLQEIQLILTQMQTELSVEENLNLILRGMRIVGFDRVRAYKFSEDSKCFVGLDSLGMDHRKDFFKGYTISANYNPYVKDMIETYKSNLKARRYHTEFGIDPNAQPLGIPSHLPWVAVPLVVAGKLYGYVSADNAHNEQEIMTDSLEYMTLFGALAAQAIANTETIETLRASKLKDEFLQRMAHIFGTTTSGVQMLVENMREGIVDSERALKEYIPAIIKVNERFLGLAQNLIDFAALREDTKLNVESVDLTSLVEDAIYHLQKSAQERGVLFETSFPSQRYQWKLDKVRVRNAIETLLDNAIKFSPKGSIVHIQLQVNDCEATVVVRDEGTGIPDEDLRFVFDAFYRGKNAQAAHVEGTGLGLAIANQTMKLHGGKAEVRNHLEGGAEFSLIFPKEPGGNNERNQEKAHSGS